MPPQEMKTTAHNSEYHCLRKIANIYGLLLIIYFIIRLLVGDGLGAVAFLNNFIPALLFPALLVLPASIKQRDGFAFGWSVFAALFLAFAFGPRFLPRNVPVTDDLGISLRILSYNTGQDLPDYAHVDNLVRESNADIVVLQEITKDYIDEYWSGLLETYPYQVYGPLEGEKQVGMGILSRYPITEVDNFKLADNGLVFQQRALVNIDDRVITLYNIHLTFPWIRVRSDPVFSRLPWPVYDNKVLREEVDNLLNLLRDEETPVIAAGDFNLTDQSNDYRRITNLLIDSYRDVGLGLGYTWPADFVPVINVRPAIPLVRVDYAFHSDNIRSLTAKVLQAMGSDHKPVVVDLVLTEE